MVVGGIVECGMPLMRDAILCLLLENENALDLAKTVGRLQSSDESCTDQIVRRSVDKEGRQQDNNEG